LEEARTANEKFLSVDPLSVLAHSSMLQLELLSGHIGTVQAEGLRLLTSSDSPLLRYLVAVGFIHDQRPQDALRVLRAMPEQVLTFAGQACRFLRLALEGQPDAARACFDPDLLDRARNVEIWSLNVSECYAFVDETDLAVDWLERHSERASGTIPTSRRTAASSGGSADILASRRSWPT